MDDARGWDLPDHRGWGCVGGERSAADGLGLPPAGSAARINNSIITILTISNCALIAVILPHTKQAIERYLVSQL